MRSTNSLIVFTLLLSLFIYLFYRTEKTLVNEIIILIFSFDTYSEIRTTVTNAIPLNEPVIFSLPGGLWVFCTTVLSKDFYLKILGYKIRVFVVPIIFTISLEFFQLLHLTNGRFDFRDIGCYLIFWMLAYYSFRPDRPQQNILSPFTLNSFICLACFLVVYLAHVG